MIFAQISADVVMFFLIGSVFGAALIWFGYARPIEIRKNQLQIESALLKKDFESAEKKLVWTEEKKEELIKEFRLVASETYGSLKDKIADLSTTTANLTEALKSPIVRGRWGELQLRRVVEMAGMVKHVDFLDQFSTDLGRPDMVVHLPNGGILPVDAKATMSHYWTAIEIEDVEARSNELSQHASALKNRIRELAQKAYWNQFETSPDFVVMFVRIEPSIGAAFEQDPDLLEYAMQNHVLVCTPVTLLALLKAVAYGWQQHQITRNAMKIIEENKELYKRVSILVEHVEDLRQSVNKTVENYNSMIGSIDLRLLPILRRLQEMGVSNDEIKLPDSIENQTRPLSFSETPKDGGTA